MERKLTAIYGRAKSAVRRTAGALVGTLVHDLRRTAVRNLNRAGVQCSTALALVGHRTKSIYRRYSIDDEASLREAVAKLALVHQAEVASMPAPKVVSMNANGN